jgi:hypothetical protein
VNDVAGNQACTNSTTITPVEGYYCGPLTGTAGPTDVLSGKTFYNTTGYKTGTMPNNGSQTSTLTITGSGKPTKSVLSGYTTGGTITSQLDASLSSSIKSGVTIGGVTGTMTEGKSAHGFIARFNSGSAYRFTLNFKPTYIFITHTYWGDHETWQNGVELGQNNSITFSNVSETGFSITQNLSSTDYNDDEKQDGWYWFASL